MADTNILWLRRDLQIADNAALHRACLAPEKIQPVFVFDTDVLARFTNKKDRRISFLANAIANLHHEFRAKGSNLLVFHGSARSILPQLGQNIFAGEDYEPSAIARDKFVGQNTNLVLVKEHVIKDPREVLKPDGGVYKIFTPYSKAWKAAVKPEDCTVLNINDSGRYANITVPDGLKIIDASTPQKICQQIGYEYFADDIWQPKNAQKTLQDFASKIHKYANDRDIPSIAGTSSISPYLRFGLVTVRQAYAIGAAHEKWLNELIWREFYAMILYHFPQTPVQEFQPKYRGLKWRTDATLLQKWKEGKTGFPIIDAGMRQLLQTGWMHNRVRMIVASFLTKDLLIDWRLGEEHFAQHLMDYEQASNVGGWQWASSTGTDAAPYFRIFNPFLQSQRFDPLGDYIAKYVPECGHNYHQTYSTPIVDHASMKPIILEFFKNGS